MPPTTNPAGTMIPNGEIFESSISDNKQDNKIEEIFLDEFKELKKIFNEDVNSKNNLENIIIKSSNKSQLSLNNIISNLNKEKLKIRDEKILKSKKNSIQNEFKKIDEENKPNEILQEYLSQIKYQQKCLLQFQGQHNKDYQ